MERTTAAFAESRHRFIVEAFKKPDVSQKVTDTLSEGLEDYMRNVKQEIATTLTDPNSPPDQNQPLLEMVSYLGDYVSQVVREGITSILADPQQFLPMNADSLKDLFAPGQATRWADMKKRISPELAFHLDTDKIDELLNPIRAINQKFLEALHKHACEKNDAQYAGTLESQVVALRSIAPTRADYDNLQAASRHASEQILQVMHGGFESRAALDDESFEAALQAAFGKATLKTMEELKGRVTSIIPDPLVEAAYPLS
jgi:hypothetical protein